MECSANILCFWIHSKTENNNQDSDRSTPPRVFLGKGVRKIRSKFTGEHLRRNDLQLFKNRTSAWVFFSKIAAPFGLDWIGMLYFVLFS